VLNRHTITEIRRQLARLNEEYREDQRLLVTETTGSRYWRSPAPKRKPKPLTEEAVTVIKEAENRLDRECRERAGKQGGRTS
jgi:hypothetical protein